MIIRVGDLIRTQNDYFPNQAKCSKCYNFRHVLDKPKTGKTNSIANITKVVLSVLQDQNIALK